MTRPFRIIGTYSENCKNSLLVKITVLNMRERIISFVETVKSDVVQCVFSLRVIRSINTKT